MRLDYYVYVLRDPSRDHLPFYVGKGRGHRKFNHYCQSYLRRSCHKSHIILRYRALGFRDEHEILAGDLSEAEAFAVEAEYIRKWGRRLDGGLLVNQTLGGEGASGHSVPRTPEWRARISQGHKGKVVSQATRDLQRAKRIGRPIKADQRAKISIALTGRVFSETHRANLSKAVKGRRLSEAHRAVATRNLRAPAGKLYRIIAPDGTESITRNLAKFCRDQGLSNQHLGSVALGRRRHHKGYRAEFVGSCDA